MEDVVLHEFAHKAVDGPARRSEALQHIGTMGVFFEGPQDRLELADDFLGAGDEIELFAC